MGRHVTVHSQSLDKIEVVTRGRVRRAGCCLLRSLRGKAARIRERGDGPLARWCGGRGARRFLRQYLPVLRRSGRTR